MGDEKIKYGLPVHVVDALKGVFKQHTKIKKVILYGSRAKGNYRDNSDIDLCLIGQSLILRDLLRIETQLDDLLLPWEIDLSLKHQIDNPNLIAHIERVGIVFYPA